MQRRCAISTHTNVRNPFVVPYVYSTDGHFTKVFGGKTTREKLGKMLPVAIQSDAAKWKHMQKEKRYTKDVQKGFIQKQNRNGAKIPAVYAHEYSALHRTIKVCAVLGRDFDEAKKKWFLLIQYWWRDNSGQYTSKTIEREEGIGDMLFDTTQQN